MATRLLATVVILKSQAAAGITKPIFPKPIATFATISAFTKNIFVLNHPKPNSKIDHF